MALNKAISRCNTVPIIICAKGCLWLSYLFRSAEFCSAARAQYVSGTTKSMDEELSTAGVVD